MRLRYSFRLYPTPGQQTALARAFGCARVVVQRRRTCTPGRAQSGWESPFGRRVVQEADH
ncbi:helix-turn-helix domain-containing protein [Saccharopolyspora sp. 5N102]|uniref:helix-turn-helix domain-containing protein n=1 Tax=Saccharopolyspora sp. 5N102 TaxID=3375155 RepID=UPI0037B0FAA3